MPADRPTAGRLTPRQRRPPNPDEPNSTRTSPAPHRPSPTAESGYWVPLACTSAIGIARPICRLPLIPIPSPPCLPALPCRHSRPRPPRRRAVWRMPGTAATRNVWRSLTPRTVPGEIESNSSRDGPRSSRSSSANGRVSSTIVSSRRSGGFARTGRRCGSPMNGETIAAIGSAAMATKTGSSTPRA